MFAFYLWLRWASEDNRSLAKKVNRKVTVPTKVESAVPNVPHQHQQAPAPDP